MVARSSSFLPSEGMTLIKATLLTGSGVFVFDGRTKYVKAIMFGAGGGGNSGTAAGGTGGSASVTGGGGGGPGEIYPAELPVSVLGASATYACGAGGLGGVGPSVTSTTAAPATTGGRGGDTILGPLKAKGAEPSSGGVNAGTLGTPYNVVSTEMTLSASNLVSAVSYGSGYVGGNGDADGATASGFLANPLGKQNFYAPGGGAGAGAIPGGPTPRSGSPGGPVLNAAAAGGLGGNIAVAGSGANGMDGIPAIGQGGGGGGGGGSAHAGTSLARTGGNGGNAGFPGGGGGGGGGAVNSAPTPAAPATAGSGGKGADGAIYLMEFG